MYEQLQQIECDSTARQMFVASNVEGLVATKASNLLKGEPIIEYRGSFSLLHEGREKLIGKANHILAYRYNLIILKKIFFSGFGNGEQTILIDGTKSDSTARCARRSCKANTVLNHAIYDGRLYVFLIANEDIDFSAEVVIHFFKDFFNK